MDIRITEEGKVCVMALSGRMDATTVNQFDEAYRALVAEGKKCVLVDMGELAYISSAGLRSILTFVKLLKSSGGTLVFCALQPMVSEVFRISGFSSMLAVHKTSNEALSALNS